MNRRWTKVRYKAGKWVRVDYDVETKDDQWDSHSMTSHDTPEQAFIDALVALAQDVADLCELCPSCATGITVQGVSLSYSAGQKDVMGATITALRKLDTANSPLVLNTPYKLECADDSETPTLSRECLDHLDDLEQAVWRYVDGNRAQMVFAFGMGQDEEAGFSALMADVRSGAVTISKMVDVRGAVAISKEES